MTNAAGRGGTISPEGSRDSAPWLETWWRDRHGWARRFHHQPFRQWTLLYSFVPDDGDEVILSGEVLCLGRVQPQRRGRELARRKGPCFHAICEGKHGVARLASASQPSLAGWDFLSDDGFFRRVSDLRIEVFQNWGEPTAWNVWKGRAEEEARKLRRRKALRRQSVPSPVEPPSQKKSQQ